ncbi:MAG: branched-chain amino acid aminotransferase [Bacteriovoracaceae bacterium]|nr:branched-chain amino acid aminotransferase [Bacteriovoracaceae bacterium]
MKTIIEPNIINLVKKLELNSDIGFGKFMMPIMLTCEYKDGAWGDLHLGPYRKFEIDPSSKVLHYGQEIFEGLKAYKNEKDELFLFRPEKNAQRFNRSADRMAMPNFPEEKFVEGVALMAAYSRQIIPRRLGESLYLRPFMFANEVGLGIAVSNNYLFTIIASPSGAYFSSDSIKVFVERTSSRAAAGGTGFAKTGGNYAAGLLSSIKCKEAGCNQVLWLDAAEKKYIEEMSGMNFFAIINGELHTPQLTNTILEGVTRDSILELARSLGYKTVEEKLPINELLKLVKEKKCTEAFVCGTASVIVPIGSFHEENGTVYKLADDEGKISLILKDKLLRIQAGLEISPVPTWIHKIPKIDF